MLASYIASLISIRTYLVGSIDNLGIRLSREELKTIQARIPQLDKAIIEASLKLDLSNVGTSVAMRNFSSTSNIDDVKTTEDLDKLVVMPVATSGTEKQAAPSETKSSVKSRSVRRFSDASE